MKALIVEKLTVREIDIENTVEGLQKFVGGHFETITLTPGQVTMLVNEEGRLLGMDYNFAASHLARQYIVGPAVIVGVDGEEFCDIPEDIARQIKLRWR